MADARKVLEKFPALHLYCARKEDWKNLFAGLLHDGRHRFKPSESEILPENYGYAAPMILDIGGQRIYVYPPR
jgi:hypothetical protein